MPELKVRELRTEEITKVWPLARTAARNNSLLGWTCQVREIASHGGGVVGVAAEDGLFHGIATFEPVEKLRAGRVLRVDTLASFELSSHAPVRRALLTELRRVASRLGCEAVTIGSSRFGSGWVKLGPREQDPI